MPDVALMTDDEVLAALAIVQQENQARYAEQDAVRAVNAKARYKYVRPLTEAADNLIEYLQNTDGRILLGLPEVDLLTRGFGAGELVYIIGFSHAGKTQVFLTMVCNNRDRRIVLFTMDEPAELVLTKLVCMRTRSNAENLEARVKAGDQEAISRVRRIARDDFRNLIVVDQSMHLDDCTRAVAEATDYWGAPPDLVGMDYLELLRTDDTEVDRKSQALKGWVVGQPFPVVCLHQGSRGNAGGGQKLTMRSGKYGGEQEAIMLLGVRRQRDLDDIDEYTRQREADTVEVSIIKNKRPPSRLGEYSYYLDPSCGLILPLHHRPEAVVHSVEQVRAQSAGQRDIFGGEQA